MTDRRRVGRALDRLRAAVGGAGRAPTAPVVEGGTPERIVGSPVVGSPVDPPLSGRFASMQDFYRFTQLDDGYPGRAEPDGTVFAHPIYGSYVLGDYLNQLAAAPSVELEEGVRRVATAALDRMDEHEGALVFWYDADVSRGARLYERHYSGLTQGYYAVELHRAGEALGDPGIVRAAARAFDSLLVPADRGGVLHEGPLGSCIAEVPQRPTSWILNGWQSALASVHRYAELSGSELARATFAEQAETMARVLPLYDIPELRNSRYGLTGFTYLRLRFDQVPAAVEDLVVEVPGEADLPVLAAGRSRWQTSVLPGDMDGSRPTGRVVRLNAVLTVAGDPSAGRLRLRVRSATGGEVRLEGMRGRYEPVKSAPVDAVWEEAGGATFGPGEVEVVIELPLALARSAAYPTNFAKKIDGRQVNIYHGVHIRRLREIGRLSGVEELTRWSDVWAGYVAEWDSLPLYRGLGVRDLRTGAIVTLGEPVGDGATDDEGSAPTGADPS